MWKHRSHLHSGTWTVALARQVEGRRGHPGAWRRWAAESGRRAAAVPCAAGKPSRLGAWHYQYIGAVRPACDDPLAGRCWPSVTSARSLATEGSTLPKQAGLSAGRGGRAECLDIFGGIQESKSDQIGPARTRWSRPIVPARTRWSRSSYQRVRAGPGHRTSTYELVQTAKSVRSALGTHRRAPRLCPGPGRGLLGVRRAVKRGRPKVILEATSI